MKYRIQKVAVLGSGIMGSGIACHLANIGLDVLMLDILPFNLSEEETKDVNKRNQLVNGALKNALKSKPASLYKKSFANRIQTGNFEDDFDKIADADWIIEVVIEDLAIKRQLFDRVEKICSPGTLISSNTSSIPINLLAEGRSEFFASHFCGTHFFNPARYLPLFEVIPHATTSPEVVDFFMEFGDILLGKQSVRCKDTPAFIANRIGVMSGIKIDQITREHQMRIEEVDAITGPLIFRPKTAHFRLQDLVGIDTGEKVSRFVSESCKDDEYMSKLVNEEPPKYMAFLLENGFLGNKKGKGFYERTKEKDEKGKRIIHALNLETLEYEPAIKPRLPIVQKTKNIELVDKRLQALMDGDERENKFLRSYFAALFAYSGNRVPEISDSYFAVDDAMRAGYMWDLGPFEYWDAFGFQNGIDLIESAGEKLAPWISEMKSSGASSFYKLQDGIKQFWDISSKQYAPVPSSTGFIVLDSLREKPPVLKNSECVVHDIGDGVMCVEFTSKNNAIGEGIGTGIRDAIKLAEDEGWNGVVIGNNAKNFTVGANLMNIGMLAMQQEFDTLTKMVHDFQQLNMYCRTSKVPVVIATQGYVFGGGCEISMHCDAGIYAAESYIGLVEVGAGLLPGGGGTKEMAVHAADKFFEGDVKIPTLIHHFRTVASAQVATSAHEAFDLGYLIEGRDEVCVKTSRNLSVAKQKVLDLAKNYVAPTPRRDIEVLGRTGMGTLYTAINEFKLAGYMSDYDVEIARKIAGIMCGGDLTSPQKVSEQYLLDLEREGFMSLLGNQKTLERIQYILQHNKPLRN